jgi:hypothetical protein
MPGSTLRGQLDARVKRIESLAAQGAIEDALAPCPAPEPKGRQGPAEQTLSQTFARSPRAAGFRYDACRPAAPILAPQHGGALLSCYHQLAQRLEREGDCRRAAFIHSQLLGEHAQAARLLEQGGLVEDAAQLAYAAQLAPSLTVRLLYARARIWRWRWQGGPAVFDELARDSRDKDRAHHIDVVKAGRSC